MNKTLLQVFMIVFFEFKSRRKRDGGLNYKVTLYR